jgi:heat shock protein HslJ
VNLPVNVIFEETAMNYRMILLVVLLVLLTTGFAGCLGEVVDFEDRDWVLESYGEPGDLQMVLEGTEITATFDSDTQEVRGSAGCNSYFGEYEVSNKQLSITALGNTEMYCMEPEGVMEQEQQYLGSLGLAGSFEREDVRFRIICSDGTVLVFRSVEEE